MITGELKGKIDRVWDAFWSGGISNPLEVIEQVTYLLFMRRLDQQQDLAEREFSKLKKTNKPMPFTPEQQQLRWSQLINSGDVAATHRTMADEVFPFLRALGDNAAGTGTTYGEHMRDARYTIPNPALLGKVMDMLNGIPLEDRDTNGDLYEYLLSKIASAGVNGQFRTPRHIIQLMVDMMAPKPGDTICDPACGTAGFLMAASEYVRRHNPDVLVDRTQSEQFHREMFHGFDFDSTMLRIGSMNMLMHGVNAPDIRYRDSLSEGASGESEVYSMILANPPFAGSLDYEATSKDLQRDVKTKKTELLFLALFLRLLARGGRAAVIVPDGVLFGSTKAHKELRRVLVEDHKLDAVVKLPSGVFKPYAGVSTAILFFTKVGVSGGGGTDDVWFYDVRADGFSLDDKRAPVAENDLGDVLARWQNLPGEQDRGRTEQSFLVPKADIVAEGYDLSINRYREVVHEEVDHRPTAEILAEVDQLGADIAAGVARLREVLG
ncbi:SAM-dependent DNA methyltransferase [Leucobacter coleopterorum]|uniref:site-specific DNA-methyltransferase (adenine-specific) n=1 Tax=Leucobacter coleopterorum TaxID=2714933 RepID=A0ABX6K3E8_9MICO|nr:class I SAM-dependent DNA methyltransferase [Leucobacter coleopterorum]QIM19565.1 SAM-dependent DNA methyltransferase [Leucobacter coleopterorum]